MKSKIRWLLIVGIFLLIIVGGWRFIRILDYPTTGSDSEGDTEVASNPTLGSSANIVNQTTSTPSSIEFAAAFLTPILFYGKVIDQNQIPVSNAIVTYSGNNIPWGGAPSHNIETDVNGLFKIRSTGITVYVGVSKDNYRSAPRTTDIAPGLADNGPVSSGTFPYAKQFAGTVHKPDSANPVIFTLYKAGNLDPLITQSAKSLSMSKDGSPTQITLNPQDSKSLIQLQCWTDSQTPNEERHYDWRFKLTVPFGGLEERSDELAFIAPASGYIQNEFEYSMRKELSRKEWKDVLSKSFFVKFENDTYAIVDVEMISHGDHYAIVGSRLNPRTGSRNLETAPPKKPKWR